MTYKLKSASPPTANSTSTTELTGQRRTRLDALRFALWQFAATHDGQFPGDDEVSSIPEETWQVEPDGKLKFIYRAGLNTTSPETVLVYEPELYDDGQLVLMTTGRVASLHQVPAGQTRSDEN